MEIGRWDLAQGLWNVRSFLACKERGCTGSWQEVEWKRKVRKQVRAIAVMGNIEGGRQVENQGCVVYGMDGAERRGRARNFRPIESRGEECCQCLL